MTWVKLDLTGKWRMDRQNMGSRSNVESQSVPTIPISHWYGKKHMGKKRCCPSSVDKKPQFSSQFDDYLHHQPVKWLTGAPPTQLWLAPLTGCALACDGCSQREGDEGRLISSRENWRDLHWGYTVIYRVN